MLLRFYHSCIYFISLFFSPFLCIRAHAPTKLYYRGTMLMPQYKPQNSTEYIRLSQYGAGLSPNDFTVQPRIDVVKVTIPFGELSSSSVVNYFKKHGFAVKFKRNNFFIMHLSGIANGIPFKMLCVINKMHYRTSLVIRQPSMDILKYLSDVLGNFYYSVSEVEYALDIYGCDNGKLFGFLASHALLKYAGILFHKSYDSTQYLNSIRHTQTYGCKVYIKNKYNEEFVRIEMTVKKRALNKMCIHFIDDIYKQEAKKVFNRLQVKELKHASFVKNKNTSNNPPYVLLDKMFKLMNTDKYCSGIVCVKEFMKMSIGNTYYYLRTHMFEDVLKEVIDGVTYEEKFTKLPYNY